MTAYGAHAFFMWIQRLFRTGRFTRLSPGVLVFALREAVKAVSSIASLRVGAAVAAWGVVFRQMQEITTLLDQAFPRLAPFLGTPSRRATLSGAAAGAVASAALPTALRRSIALHGAVRGAALIAAPTYAAAPAYLRRCAPVAAFTACSSVIMGCWFYAPHALPRMMRRWISAMAQMDHRLLTALRLLRSGEARYGAHHDALASYCVDHGLPPSMGDPLHGQLSCRVVHPASGTACWHNVAMRWRNGFLAAAALYLPVHFLSQGIACVAATNSATSCTGSPAGQPTEATDASVPASRDDVYESGMRWLRAFLQRVPGGVRRALEGALRSSGFLATFIASIWGTICCMRHALGDDTVAGPLLGSTLAGLSVLLEAPGRRGELSLYLLPRALQSAWALLLPTQRVAGFSVAALAFASACVAREMEKQRGSGGVQPPPDAELERGGASRLCAPGGERAHTADDSSSSSVEDGSQAGTGYAALGGEVAAPIAPSRRRQHKALGVSLVQWMSD